MQSQRPISGASWLLLCMIVGVIMGIHHVFQSAAMQGRVLLDNNNIADVDGVVDNILHVSYQRIPQKNNSTSSSSNNATKLEFVHIPKTGGTAVELAGAQAGIQWGMCHFRTLPPDYAPNKQITPKIREKYAGCFQPLIPRHQYPSIAGEKWHLPPPWLLHDTFPSEQNFYRHAGVALFAVVRNPYTKLLSEYYCPWSGYCRNDKNEATLNSFLQDKLRCATGSNRTHGKILTHMIPQVEFIFDMEAQQQSAPKQVVNHVLFHEDLAAEMGILMVNYDMPPLILQLISDGINRGQTGSNHQRMGIANLTLATVELIHLNYELDFDLLGYKRIPFQTIANSTTNDSSLSTTTVGSIVEQYDHRSVYMP